jgi:hypothetical protein
MSKRRLKTILDLSCGNSGKTNTNLEKNIKNGNQTFKDFLSAAEFVFEDFESDLVNLSNVNVVQNNVNNMMLQTENITYEMNQISEDDYAVHLAHKSSVREENSLIKAGHKKMKFIVLLLICKLLNFVHL